MLSGVTGVPQSATESFRRRGKSFGSEGEEWECFGGDWASRRQEERRRADICKDVLALRPLFRSYVLLRKDIRSFLQRTWHIESPGHPFCLQRAWTLLFVSYAQTIPQSTMSSSSALVFITFEQFEHKSIPKSESSSFL